MDKPYCVRTNMRRWDGEKLTSNIMTQMLFVTYKEADGLAKKLNETHKYLLEKGDLFFYATFK